MFHHWKKRVLAEGAQAEGQVYGLTSYARGMDFGVKVRVKLPDGSTAEFEKGPLESQHVGMLFVGSVVPVRYDPADPRRSSSTPPPWKPRTRRRRRASRRSSTRSSSTSAIQGRPPAPRTGWRSCRR
jgi:hypothetical protein